MDSRRIRRFILVVSLWLLLCSVILAGTSCRRDKKESPPSGVIQTNAQGYSLAPDFTLADQSGQTHRLSDYRGRIVYLTFWASWCDPCLQELPDIEQLYQDRGSNTGDLVVLGVVFPSHSDGSAEGNEQHEKTSAGINEFLKENSLTFPVLFDEQGSTFSAYDVTGLPTTYLIDREGYFIGVIPASIERAIMDHFVEEAMGADYNGK